eukprot:753790-Hanusia_phi.AAC.2
MEAPLSQLMIVLTRAATFPEEHEEWKENEQDEFRNFRLEALFDAVLDLSSMFGSLRGLKIVLPELQKHVQSCSWNQDGWRAVEGCLFIVRVLARHISTDENEVVPALLSLYTHLPEHPRVRQVTLASSRARRIGSTSEPRSGFHRRDRKVLLVVESAPRGLGAASRVRSQGELATCWDCGGDLTSGVGSVEDGNIGGRVLAGCPAPQSSWLDESAGTVR